LNNQIAAKIGEDGLEDHQRRHAGAQDAKRIEAVVIENTIDQQPPENDWAQRQ
jgi:hypothetical protein